MTQATDPQATGPRITGTQFLEVGPERAADLVAVIHEAFGDRPALDPPATATAETEQTVAASLAAHGGLLAVHDDRPVGSVLFAERDGLLMLRRVGVLHRVRHLGVAARLVRRAEEIAAARGYRGMVLEARAELPKTVRFWQRLGYAEVDRDGPRLWLERRLPVSVRLPEPEDTRALGERLGATLRAGDLVILSGDLGAGKTTLAQGIGAGLGVRGPVTSPTFVISRVHPTLTGGPALVHVDAYRLGDAAELDDLDLDTDLDRAVTIVEWGSGLAEALAGSRLEIRLTRAPDDVRTLALSPVGPRWFDADLDAVTSPAIA